MRQYILILMCLMGIQTIAQEKVRITMKDHTTLDFDIRAIKEIDFYQPKQIEAGDIVGEFITFSDDEVVTLECWEFKENGDLKYNVYYVETGLNYEYDGTYTLIDNVLTISIFGSTFTDLISIFTGTELVSYSLTYYKVQNHYNISISDIPINIGIEGDVIKLVDNCYIGMKDNKITPLKVGRGYALVEDAETKALKAYSINVTPTE